MFPLSYDCVTCHIGRLTGECDTSVGHCVINGWCPVENEDKDMT